MITAEQIHDALSHLPEELLVPVDALRQKKRFHWQPLAALAACACLVVGLWLFLPAVSMDSSNGAMAPEEGFGDGSLGSIADQITQESSGTYALCATIVEITEDYLIAQPDRTEPVTVQLDALKQLPALSVGQQIRIFCKEIPDETTPLVPYRIEIIEE